MINSCVSVSGHQRGIFGGGCTCREAAASEQAREFEQPARGCTRAMYLLYSTIEGNPGYTKPRRVLQMSPTRHNAVRAADGAAVHLRPWSPRWSSRPTQSLGRPPTPGSQQRGPNRANDNLLTKTSRPKKSSHFSKLEPR